MLLLRRGCAVNATDALFLSSNPQDVPEPGCVSMGARDPPSGPARGNFVHVADTALQGESQSCGGKNQHVGGRKSPAWAWRELWSGESHSIIGWTVGLKGT